VLLRQVDTKHSPCDWKFVCYITSTEFSLCFLTDNPVYVTNTQFLEKEHSCICIHYVQLYLDSGQILSTWILKGGLVEEHPEI